MKRPKMGDLVLCEWEDSYGCSSTWTTIEPQTEPAGMICKSVGWLIRESKKFIVVVPHLSDNNAVAERQGCGDMTIPRAAIIRLQKIAVN